MKGVQCPDTETLFGQNEKEGWLSKKSSFTSSFLIQNRKKANQLRTAFPFLFLPVHIPFSLYLRPNFEKPKTLALKY